ncbi:SIMPL domain-containing protein [[Eubacterium] cellulosolvens]
MDSEKTFYRIIAIAIVALLALNAMTFYLIESSSKQRQSTGYTPLALSTSQEPSVNLNTIVVTGTGTIHAKPDVSMVNIGVQTESKTAQEALQQNSDKMNSVMESLKTNGIQEGNIKTLSYRLDPIMRYDENTPALIGYTAVNTIQITLEDVNMVGTIIDISVSAGANLVHNIQFTVSKDRLDDLREDAIDAAVNDAQQKADAISRSLGVRLIGPISVSLTPGYEPRPYYEEARIAGTPITPGDLEISSNVQVSYAFE